MSVKRRDIVRYFEQNGFYVLREGANHSIYTNGTKIIPIKRHSRLDRITANELCKKLESSRNFKRRTGGREGIAGLRTALPSRCPGAGHDSVEKRAQGFLKTWRTREDLGRWEGMTKGTREMLKDLLVEKYDEIAILKALFRKALKCDTIEKFETILDVY